MRRVTLLRRQRRLLLVGGALTVVALTLALGYLVLGYSSGGLSCDPDPLSLEVGEVASLRLSGAAEGSAYTFEGVDPALPGLEAAVSGDVATLAAVPLSAPLADAIRGEVRFSAGPDGESVTCTVELLPCPPVTPSASPSPEAPPPVTDPAEKYACGDVDALAWDGGFTEWERRGRCSPDFPLVERGDEAVFTLEQPEDIRSLGQEPRVFAVEVRSGDQEAETSGYDASLDGDRLTLKVAEQPADGHQFAYVLVAFGEYVGGEGAEGMVCRAEVVQPFVTPSEPFSCAARGSRLACATAISSCQDGATCTGARSACSGEGSLCAGEGSACQAGATCSGAASSCEGPGTTCAGADSTCSRGATCDGSQAVCLGAGTRCTGIGSSCREGAICPRLPPAQTPTPSPSQQPDAGPDEQ